MVRGYLIRGGEVHDGTGAAAQHVDVRVRGKKIVAIGERLPVDGDQLIDASGLIVAPGLIDLHVHVFTGMGQFALDPAEIGLRTGVTAMLDTGTAGAALTYPTFAKFVMPAAREDVYALLNISMLGCLYRADWEPHLSDLTDARAIHVPSAVACLKKYPERLLGMKARLTAEIAGGSEANERAAFTGALEAARKTGTRCMLHHVASAIPVQEVAEAMRAGDIYTHTFHARENGPFGPRKKGERRAPVEAVRAARERGVIFDVGHGVGSFAWAVAEAACQEHGFWPDTISTDLHTFNIDGPVYDMATTMTKFLHLGMPLERVIRASTFAPAQAMGLESKFGRLAKGRAADVTLLELVKRKTALRDVLGKTRTAAARLVVRGCWKDGVRFDAGAAR